jgi:hypothetical protein
MKHEYKRILLTAETKEPKLEGTYLLTFKKSSKRTIAVLHNGDGWSLPRVGTMSWDEFIKQSTAIDEVYMQSLKDHDKQLREEALICTDAERDVALFAAKAYTDEKDDDVDMMITAAIDAIIDMRNGVKQ